LSEPTINIYNRQAKEYESKWGKYLAHTHEAFLRRIETEVDDRILDVSGGTGLLAKQLIDRDYSFEHLIINGPSDQMLAIARDRFSDNPKIGFTNKKVEQIWHENDYFDRIFCLNSFHYYAHQQQVLDRFYDMLKPEGKFYLLDWNRSGFFRLINQFIQWSSSEYIDTRSLAEFREMFCSSGFEVHASDEWTWWYWIFLFFEGYKPK
jgi:ubiquinone/menaquinone biosynthesis C-methylase UbiE